MAGLTIRGEHEPRFAGGLLPVVVQSGDDGAVLMLAWANEAALEATVRTGEAHFWSRSRSSLWRKGETSGNLLRVDDIAVDCDGDALLYRVRAAGPACHTGARSCFDPQRGRPSDHFSLAELEHLIASRAAADPAHSYTARLLADGPRAPAAKVVEEAGETAVAGVAQSADDVADEAADLLYHLLVLLRARDVALATVLDRLAARRR
ncbi:MAG: bifunctional phosphoribosyl-AMP cyclohydrolase/phosphoribosyl-ATP diphosphatase HisIE [Chloroflexota bacterium]|nr:bifunctional phosphoribosyl-AMP cyclohydrolase/phosphoribosyl-ATP diphosphatase HisIE [Chloroflexota bacterium]